MLKNKNCSLYNFSVKENFGVFFSLFPNIKPFTLTEDVTWFFNMFSLIDMQIRNFWAILEFDTRKWISSTHPSFHRCSAGSKQQILPPCVLLHCISCYGKVTSKMLGLSSRTKKLQELFITRSKKHFAYMYLMYSRNLWNWYR